MENVESISCIICRHVCGMFASNPVVPWVHVEGWAVCDCLSLVRILVRHSLVRILWQTAYVETEFAVISYVLYMLGIHYLILQCMLSQDLTKTASDFIILNIRQISAGSISLCISR